MKRRMQRVLICGYGSMGKKYHSLITKQWKEVEIVLLTNQELIGMKENARVEIVRDINRALEKECTHAIVSNAANLHVDFASILLDNGINTLVEKPLLTNQNRKAQLEKLKNIKNKEKAFVGYVLRQDVIIKKIKQVIESGELGELIAIEVKCGSWLPDWRPDRNYKETVSAKSSKGGGVLLELSHEIDLAIYLAGDFEVKYGITRNTGILNIETDDIAAIAGVTKKGALVNIGIDFCSKPSRRFGEIKLSNGSISYDLINRKVLITEYNKGKTNQFQLQESSMKRLMKQIDYLLENESYQREDFCSIVEGIEVINKINEVKRA